MRVLLLAFTVLFMSASQALPKGKWKLIWKDEFNGPRNSAPDSAKWTYDLGAGGWGNHELESYTNKIENASLDGSGHLVVTVRRDQAGSYTSARLKTLGKFDVTYGKIAARIKIPYGPGIWPAFWMLGANISQAKWPTCGEIDIMENIGKEPSAVHWTVHGPGYSGGKGITSQVSLPGNLHLSQEFHIFAVEWTPASVGFFLDGRAYAKVVPESLPQGARWVFDHPFFLLLNVAVGGEWPGNPDKTTTFPQRMVVDWVRVWKPAMRAH